MPTEDSFTDTDKVWTVDDWAGATVTYKGKTMKITSNTPDRLTVAEICGKCSNPIGTGTRWQAAIKSSEGPRPREEGSTPAGVGWYWVDVCTPCFWLVRPHRSVCGTRGELLEGEIE